MAGTFLLVNCPDCENEQTLFEKAATPIECSECGEPLARPTGGKAQLYGTVTDVVEAR